METFENGVLSYKCGQRKPDVNSHHAVNSDPVHSRPQSLRVVLTFLSCAKEKSSVVENAIQSIYLSHAQMTVVAFSRVLLNRVTQ